MRPSRRPKPPGTRPAAANFSRYSTVSGKKSCPGFGDGAAVTVASTQLSPHRASTAPWAWRAMRPVSNVISVPAILTAVRWAVGCMAGSCPRARTTATPGRTRDYEQGSLVRRMATGLDGTS